MTTPIESEMRATYTACKRWWRRLIILWVATLVVAGAAQLEIHATLSAVATIAAFLGAVLTFAFRWRADAFYHVAEDLRRLQLISDGLGEEANPSELARVRAAAAIGDSPDPAPIGGYYTSREPRGWRRVMHNIEESAYYTEDLARVAAWTCAIALVAVVVAGFVILYVVLITQDVDNARAVAGATLAVVTTVIGGTLADLSRAYFALVRAAGSTLERARVLTAAPDVSEREALEMMAKYDAALVSAPPIPGFIYRRRQRRLDEVWNGSRGEAPPNA